MKGHGRIEAPGKVIVKGDDGQETTLETRRVIVIATGSDVARLPGVEIDEKTVVSSTGALSLPVPPKKLIVVGAGVIGLEMGSVWRRLGAEVTVVEFLDHILTGIDREVSTQMQRVLAKQGFAFQLGHKVAKVEKTDAGVKATIEPAAGGEAKTIEADAVLMAIGRRAFTEGLGLEALDVALDRGQVVVDAHFATNVSGIYAIGDVIRGPMLAHKAQEEGVAVAELLAGQAGHVNYGVIPNVVYTSPEVASVGKSEEELKAEGVAYAVGKFPFTANGRARAMRHTDGFVKILADAASDRVLGGHIVGFGAGEMIHEIAVLMEFGGAAEDLARTCHAHPTMSEAVRGGAGSRQTRDSGCRRCGLDRAWPLAEEDCGASECGNLGEENLGEFVVARGDGPEMFELVEEPFNEIAFAVEGEIARTRGFAVGFGWDDWGDRAGVEGVDEGVGVKGLVGDQSAGIDGFDRVPFPFKTEIMGIAGFTIVQPSIRLELIHKSISWISAAFAISIVLSEELHLGRAAQRLRKSRSRRSASRSGCWRMNWGRGCSIAATGGWN